MLTCICFIKKCLSYSLFLLNANDDKLLSKEPEFRASFNNGTCCYQCSRFEKQVADVSGMYSKYKAGMCTARFLVITL